MGKPQVPPNDPQRLARVQNEKLRMIGVRWRGAEGVGVRGGRRLTTACARMAGLNLGVQVDKEALHLQIEERKASEAREREESRWGPPPTAPPPHAGS